MTSSRLKPFQFLMCALQMNHLDAFKSFSAATEEGIDDVLLNDQQFFVFQLAHAYTSIRSDDGNPWIRCIGFTRTLDAARTLARNAFSMGDKMETRIMPAGRVFLAGKHKYEGLDLPRREEEQFKANKLVDDWIALRERVHKETQKLASDKAVLPDPFGEETFLKGQVPAGADDHVKELPANSCRQTAAVHEGETLAAAKDDTVHVDRQGAWACAIIPDLSGDIEPALIPLFAANDAEDVHSLVRRAAACKDLVHMDIFVGRTCEWQPLINPAAAQAFHHHPLRQAMEGTIRWVRN